MTQSAITANVPLKNLFVHELNTRTAPSIEEIKLLADSIQREGLLQNLCGLSEGSGEAAQYIGVVAGGRRLRALQMLHGTDSDLMVPVNVTSDREQARDWAGAENTARAQLHPADEIRTYGKMNLAGRSVSDIAKAFAVREDHVKQRISLCRLPTEALDALREDKITLSVAQALTRETDKKRLAGVLDAAIQKRLTAEQVARVIKQDRVEANDRRVIYVGLANYELAGGRVMGTLFDTDVILQDADLLGDLFAAKLEAEAQAWQARGAAWVKTTPEYYLGSDLERELPKGFRECYPPSIDLPEADQTELESLEARNHWDLDDAEKGRRDALRDRTIGEFDDEAISALGIVLLVPTSGKLKVRYYAKAGFIDPTSDNGTVETIRPKAETIPQNLTDDLAAIRQASIQMRMMEQFEHLLDLLTYQVAYVQNTWEHPLGVALSPARIDPGKTEGTTLPTRLSDFEGEKARNFTPEGFAEFKALGKKHRNQVLATHLARTFKDTGLLSAAFAASLNANPREIWTPTAAGYLGRITVGMLDAIFNELVPEESNADRADFHARKKGDKAKFLEGLFNDMSVREALGLSREQNAKIDAWLPEQLRWPAIEDAA